MPPLDQFNVTIVAADSLVAMYRELRQSRHLGARGRLDAANADLLWLPRSAIVVSVSALDAYVHHVVEERVPHILRGHGPPPDALCERLSTVLTIRNAASFKDALPMLTANDTLDELVTRLKDQSLSFLAFQAPEKVEEAYRLLGHEQIFEAVAAIWQGPNTEPNDLKRRLSAYVRRRNQIAHEGDLEANGQPRPIQPDYGADCRAFITGLVLRLNQVVYEM